MQSAVVGPHGTIRLACHIAPRLISVIVLVNLGDDVLEELDVISGGSRGTGLIVSNVPGKVHSGIKLLTGQDDHEAIVVRDLPPACAVKEDMHRLSIAGHDIDYGNVIFRSARGLVNHILALEAILIKLMELYSELLIIGPEHERVAVRPVILVTGVYGHLVICGLRELSCVRFDPFVRDKDNGFHTLGVGGLQAVLALSIECSALNRFSVAYAIIR